jgi:hypothetical protein
LPLDRSEQRCVDDHFIEFVGYGQRVDYLSLRIQSRPATNRYAYGRGSHIHGPTGNDSHFDTMRVPIRAMSIVVRQTKDVRSREDSHETEDTSPLVRSRSTTAARFSGEPLRRCNGRAGMPLARSQPADAEACDGVLC